MLRAFRVPKNYYLFDNQRKIIIRQGQLMKSKIRYSFLYIIFVIIIHATCTNNPNTPNDFGAINLNFNIVGHKISEANSLMKPLEWQAFTRLIIEVFSSALVTDNLSNLESIAQLELQLSPNDTSFEGRLEVPAGEDQLLVAKLFQANFLSPAEAVDVSETLTFCGRKKISVTAGATVEVNVDLYPVPIRGKRVVIHIGSIELKTNDALKFLPLSVANLDSLRGVQFDMYLDSRYLKLNSVQKTERTATFSDANFNYLASYNDEARILLFDKTEGAVLLPVEEACVVPEPAVNLGISSSAEAEVADNRLIPLTISRAIVTSTAFKTLEVWIKDGEIILTK